MFEGDFGVFGRLDPLQNEGKPAAFAHAVHGFPGQPCLMDTGVFPVAFDAGRPPACDKLTFAPPVIGRIHGKTERGVACVPGPVDEIIDPVRVPANIDLEDFRVIRRCRDFFQGRLGDRTDKV